MSVCGLLLDRISSIGGLRPARRAARLPNIGDAPGRLLVIATPSGVERFFEQCAELLTGPLDTETLAAITEANWSKSVGPPLGVSDPL
jgi:hypothetical protein